jgi:hypothetical protein
MAMDTAVGHIDIRGQADVRCTLRSETDAIAKPEEPARPRGRPKKTKGHAEAEAPPAKKTRKRKAGE